MPPGQRLDKWLWYARFFKTRSLATRQVSEGKVRVNGARVTKAAHIVAPGDVLTFAQAHDIRVVRIRAAGERRGPAAEAQLLYEDLQPPEKSQGTDVPPGPRFEGRGRPTKKDRRDMASKGPGGRGGRLE